MANIAQMVNVLQSPILTDGARMVRTPTYYAFLMYVPFQGAAVLPVQLDSPKLGTVPAIDVTAAKGAKRAVYIGLVNADPDDSAEVQLSIAGAAGRHVSGRLLTAPAMDSRNRFGAAEEVHPVPFKGALWREGKLRVAMPAKSIVVLALE
jgi:alpha-N-arabinofuranosidase